MISKFINTCDNLLDNEMDYTTKMYLDELNEIDPNHNNKLNLELFEKLNEVIGKLNLIFLKSKLVNVFEYKYIYDQIKAYLDVCDNVDDINQVNNLYSEYIKIRNDIVNNNLDLVLDVVRRYVSKGGNVDLDEAIQCGNMALIDTIDTYNNDDKILFSAYARISIGFYIQRHAFKEDLKFSVPFAFPVRYYKFMNANYKFYGKHGRWPSDQELADILECSIKMIKKMKKLMVTLDNQVSVNEIDSCGNDLDYQMIAEERNKDVNELFLHLTEKQRRILEYRYGFVDGRSYKYEEIGKLFGVSKQNVHLMEHTAFERIKKRSKRLKQLKLYLED